MSSEQGPIKVLQDNLLVCARAIQAQQREIVLLQERIEVALAAARVGQRVWQLWNAEPYIATADQLRMPDESGQIVMGFSGDEATSSEPGEEYPTFEAVFRGPSSRIRQLLLPYVSLLRDYQPVVELGCGTGELLELLEESSIECEGVELDPGMSDICARKGIAVTTGDLFEVLKERPNGTVGGIVSVQVIEHVDPYRLSGLFRECLRVLKPGGIFVAETINPHHLPSHKLFWLDPTHRHLLFPEAVLVIAKSVGFAKGRIAFFDGTGKLESDIASCDRYAAIAWKGTSPE
jgi:SAM-dependent methyltransferase